MNQLFKISLLSVLLFVVGFWPTTASAGYTGYSWRASLTIPYTWFDASLTDFPILFTQANLPAAIFTEANADGGDIRFSSDSAGDTPLNREIVSFDTSGNTAEIWVKVPSLSNSVDTVIYVWYGNAGASEPTADDADEGSQGVWDANFKGVWHMESTASDVSNHYLDSTANANHFTGTSMAITPTASPWGSGYSAEFDGANDYLNRPVLNTAYPFTYSAWAYPDSVDDGTYHIVGENNYQMSWSNMNMLWMMGATANDPVWAYSRNPTELYSAKTGMTTAWHHTAGSFDTASRIAYLDGISGTEETTSDTWSGTKINLMVGGFFLGWSLYTEAVFDGKIDEVRVSDTTRSSAWIKAEYNTGNSPASITDGTPEDPAGGSVSRVIRLSGGLRLLGGTRLLGGN